MTFHPHFFACISFRFNGASMVLDEDMLGKAHYMLRPFLLRRLKVEVEQKLPPKLETLVRCPLSDMQRFWIKRLLLKNSELLKRFEEGEGSKFLGNYMAP